MTAALVGMHAVILANRERDYLKFAAVLRIVRTSARIASVVFLFRAVGVGAVDQFQGASSASPAPCLLCSSAKYAVIGVLSRVITSTRANRLFSKVGGANEYSNS